MGTNPLHVQTHWLSQTGQDIANHNTISHFFLKLIENVAQMLAIQVPLDKGLVGWQSVVGKENASKR